MKFKDKRFREAIERFDRANSEDPNIEMYENKEFPKELLYAQRITRWLERLDPNASQKLHLAARSQHIRRWEIPRSRYPMDKRGYYMWRKTLGEFHAHKAEQILEDVGYDAETITGVKSLLKKEHIKTDPEMQVLEDVICLVFLESYFSDFSKQHDKKKLHRIIQKTWKKMSPKGHKVALELELPEESKSLIKSALSGSE